jgi:hypothetical protein
MWDGLVTDPLAKALRAEEDDRLRLGNLVWVGMRVIDLLLWQISSRATGSGQTATTAATSMGATWWGRGGISLFIALNIMRLLAIAATASLYSTRSWVFFVVMAAEALPFVIAAAGCVILVTTALHAVIMAILLLFPRIACRCSGYRCIPVRLLLGHFNGPASAWERNETEAQQGRPS